MSNFEPDEKMLNKYIQDKLNDADTKLLELWLVDHPEKMQDLELGLMFAQAKDAYKQKSKSFSLLRFFTNRTFVPIHVLAYLLLGIVTFNLFNSVPNSTNSTATFIELEKQRGLDTSIIQVQTEKNKSLVIRLFPDSMTEKYTLTMLSKSSNQKIVFKDLQADDFGSITLTVNNTVNISGEWEVLLVDSNDKQEQSYLMNLKSKLK
jgi:hypothetical protein